MAEESLKVDRDVKFSDLERLHLLNRALLDVDEFLDKSEFEKNDFVQKILDLSPDETQKNKEKIAIDFSSPNIAKPFHVGHLRSTFIGRAIANLNSSNGAEVIRINYLGDWGTQFGLLAAGYDLFQEEDHQIRAAVDGRRLRQYFDVYVKANERAEIDGEFRQKALKYFANLENGADETGLRFWRRVVDDSVAELKCLYSRLNVQFDAWESENAVALPSRALVEDLERKGFLERTNDNVVGIRTGDLDRFMPLVKSDRTTLYLTRDICTAIQRFDNLSCSKLIYVTDQSQHDHFRQLKFILSKIGRSDVAEGIVHARFGRITNMSTRKGLAVFVDDLLDEGANRAEEIVLKPDSKTKTLSGTDERRLLAEQLALSGLVVNDLRKRRSLEYEFDWSRVLETKKDSGVSLQKTFCRLSSICHQCRTSFADLDDFGKSTDLNTFGISANEKESAELIVYLSRNLAPTIRRSLNTLEMFPLAQYLFRLRKLSSAAVRQLRLNDAPTPAIRSSRFLLFDVARKVLGLGLRLLGAKPLAKI